MITICDKSCETLWGNTSAKLLDRTTKLQKRAIRTVTKSAYNANTAPLFKANNIMSLPKIYKFETLKLMHSIFNQYCPSKLSEPFIRNLDIHHHHTRQVNNLFIQMRRSHKIGTSILHAGPKMWTALPPELKSNTSKHSFKRQIKKEILKYE